MRFFKLFFLALLVLGFAFPTQADDATGKFFITYPNERVEYHLGDTLHLEWRSENFQPSAQSPIHVYLVDLRTQRTVRVGRITRASADNTYEVNWEIPDDLFSRWHLGDRENAYFWLDLRAFNQTHWVRLKTRQSMMKIFNSDGGDHDTIDNTTSDANQVSPSQLDEPIIYLPKNSVQVSRFEIRAGLEPWVLERLSIVSDTQNDGFEHDPNEGTPAIKRLYLEYTDRYGERNLQPADFINGQARFHSLNIYIDRLQSTEIKVWMELAARETLNEQFSGQRFRLGLQTIGNTESTYRAVGQHSGTVDTTMSSLNLAEQDPAELITRFSVLDFAVVEPIERVLTGGDQPVYELAVASSGSVGLHRMVFDVSQSGVTQIDEVRLLRNGRIEDDVELYWDAGASSCDATTAQNGAGTGMDCNGGTAATSKLIVAFTQEQVITNSPTVYRLDFRIGGVSTNGVVTVRLAAGDDSSALSVGGSVDTTGYLYNGGGGNELFSNASDFFTEATSLTNRNIVWSDRSANDHRFPSVSPGNPPSLNANGSADFTNGYLLKVNVLPTVDSVR